MAGVSTSHLIIFVASLIVAAGVAGTLTTGVEQMTGSIDDGSIDVSQQIKMDMEIVSDPKAEYDEGTQLTVHVRNTGSQGVPIEESQFDLIFNNQFLASDEFEVEHANGDETTWRPNRVVSITITGSDIQLGDNRLVVEVNGDRERFHFLAEELFTISLDPKNADIDSAEHNWTSDTVTTGGLEVEEIDVDYDAEGDTLDGLDEEDVTLEIARSDDRTQPAINDGDYSGDSATIDIHGGGDDAIANDRNNPNMILSIDGASNPSAGDYSAEITLNLEDGSEITDTVRYETE